MCGRYDHPPYDDNNGYGHLGDGVSGRTGDPEPDCPCGHMSDEHDLRGQTSERYDCLACGRDHREGEHDREIQMAGCCDTCNAYIDGPSIRVGSDHEETPISGDSWCSVCGLVQSPTADRTYHPEAYVNG